MTLRKVGIEAGARGWSLIAPSEAGSGNENVTTAHG